MLKLPVYLDYSATTPVDPRVAKKMITYLTEILLTAGKRKRRSKRPAVRSQR